MVARQKTWVYAPKKQKKPVVPEDLKDFAEEKARLLVDNVLKPEYVKPPEEGDTSSYLVDIFTKWYRNYLYFCGMRHCRAPNCITEFYEQKFARMEYVGDGRFNLAYMRHTEQWWETHVGVDLDECLNEVQKNIFFY
ncbi:MAG: hypothetical protein HQL80_08760 [Magnetococcales bacterium]|nr:hypothetical protein [Magnetococcales bacterium]